MTSKNWIELSSYSDTWEGGGDIPSPPTPTPPPPPHTHTHTQKETAVKQNVLEQYQNKSKLHKQFHARETSVTYVIWYFMRSLRFNSGFLLKTGRSFRYLKRLLPQDYIIYYVQIKASICLWNCYFCHASSCWVRWRNIDMKHWSTCTMYYYNMTKRLSANDW